MDSSRSLLLYTYIHTGISSFLYLFTFMQNENVEIHKRIFFMILGSMPMSWPGLNFACGLSAVHSSDNNPFHEKIG